MKKFSESQWFLPIIAAALSMAFSIVGLTQATTIGTNIDTGGELTVSGVINATSTLRLDGAATFNGAVTLGDAYADTLTLTGRIGSAVYASSTLQATGAARLYSTLRIDGTTTFAGETSLTATSTATAIFIPASYATLGATPNCSATSGATGGIIYNSTGNWLCVCDGTSWKVASSSTDVCFH
ncbi:MAG: hypothetical protein HY764_02670 [Candidatus Portnoybacteria bacterium]|nr:hypothetical protein [Candidatus Portnoybacteria bacterium]